MIEKLFKIKKMGEVDDALTFELSIREEFDNGDVDYYIIMLIKNKKGYEVHRASCRLFTFYKGNDELSTIELVDEIIYRLQEKRTDIIGSFKTEIERAVVLYDLQLLEKEIENIASEL